MLAAEEEDMRACTEGEGCTEDDDMPKNDNGDAKLAAAVASGDAYSKGVLCSEAKSSNMFSNKVSRGLINTDVYIHIHTKKLDRPDIGRKG